jgi:hypothetical protein
VVVFGKDFWKIINVRKWCFCKWKDGTSY